MQRSRGASFAVLELAHPAAAGDRLAGLLAEAGTLGIEERRGRLRAYFAAPPPAALLARLTRAGARSIARHTLADRDWVGQSRRLAPPVRVGRLLVRAPWSRARPVAGGLELVIDPARAFGTGSHESTRLVLERLVARPPQGARLLDIGSGSGILALSALLLGARHAVAIDVDPEAVAATAENAARNRLERGLEVVLGGPEVVGGRRFGIVLANLTAALLIRHAGAIAARVAARGELVCAGFLGREDAAVGEALAAEGLFVTASDAAGEWSLLCLRHRSWLRTRRPIQS